MDSSLGNGAGQREAKLYAIIGRKDYQIEELQEENAALRARLDAALKQNVQSRNATNATGRPSGPASPEASSGPREVFEDVDLETLRRAHRELQSRHQNLEALHRACEPRINALDAKCKDYKNKVLLWKQYIDKQTKEGRIPQSKNAENVQRDSAPAECQPVDGNHARAADLMPHQERVLERTHDLEQRSSALPSARSSAAPSKSPARADVDEPIQTCEPHTRATSSQTTVEETQPPARTIDEIPNSSDDEPELVSERCLKRKAGPRAMKRSPARRIKLEPRSPDGAVLLSSDPPLPGDARSPRIAPLQLMYSDLDRIEVPKVTDQQPRGVESIQDRARSVEHSRPAPQLSRSMSSRSEGNLDTLVRAAALVPTTTDPSETPSKVAAREESSTFNKQALRPISVNVPRSNGGIRNTKRKSKASGLRGKVDILSEDGDDSSQVNAAAKDTGAPPKHQDDKLAGLLMGLPSDTTPASSRSVRRSARHSQVRTPAQPPTPLSGLKAKSPSKSPSKRLLPRGIEPPPRSLQPEEEPLRLRDVRTLRREDFKVNPKYLGTDMAFADTLRGRDERRNLHVCTKPDCCGGAMQKVMAMGGQKLTGKSDAQVLTEYLGPQYRQIMSKYGTTKQKETVLQAYAHVFAREHGKHRQAFERQSTPPGFWRTDFPTTQEDLEDRQKAQEAERREVEARYREAMRPGGQYIFRDE
ncbi:hypothetical protein CB0940_03424 [Cercospora beticola]|uniref:DNA endonuclease activator Ctp1 C-terminal domain-containing protein n=1 Tax=Cercospora beticola TaxID=122368 RepID=A0A2G5I3A5_CERBT|nr:hypothetical protein CB0940_03424 [Cercospora beticola]PIA98992.1 hypothetical protein CB0940_03424 [Cercospora beticola]WPB00600.1 hypothetical protein RHO25_005220 [Cercospora beticola]CAK1361182.1 unnamed protein product [Cercospora beticola]